MAHTESTLSYGHTHRGSLRQSVTLSSAATVLAMPPGTDTFNRRRPASRRSANDNRMLLIPCSHTVACRCLRNSIQLQQGHIQTSAPLELVYPWNKRSNCPPPPADFHLFVCNFFKLCKYVFLGDWQVCCYALSRLNS